MAKRYPVEYDQELETVIAPQNMFITAEDSEAELSEVKMDIGEKVKILKQEMDDRIKYTARKRVSDKKRAFGIKILAVCFAASVTVLLGLKVNENLAGILQSIALVLSAVITVLNAVEAFYDHRSLWIRRTVTLSKLYALRSELNFVTAGVEESEIDIKSLERFLRRYERILQDDLRSWLKMRQDNSSLGEAKSKDDG